MDFELTEEQKMLQDMAYRFARANFTALSQPCDEQEKYTPEIRMKAAAQGLVGAWVPEEYGGAGAGCVGSSIITEELSKVDMGICLNVTAATFGCEAIFQYGSEEQKRTYLPPVCSGEKVCAGAFTEPNAGTDVAGYKTRAVKDGSDYVINGSKMFITNGTVCDFMVAQCITNPEEKKHNSFSLIIVPADAKGVTRTKIHGKLGIRASDTAEIALEDVRVPQANLVGKEGQGFRELMHFFDTTRVMVAAQALGLSEACLETSVKYVKERTAFGAAAGRLSAYADEAHRDGDPDRGPAGAGVQGGLADRRGKARLYARGDGEVLRRADRRLLRKLRRGAPRGVRVHRGVPRPEMVPRRQDPRAVRGDEGGGDHDHRAVPPEQIE